MTQKRVVAQIRRKPSPEEHDAIRREWIAHSIAEDSRDIPGLMSTLTEDCEYVLVNTGDRWEGKEGATRFYTEMLAAFPDIHFDLQHIVIGPQGVWEEAHVTGTHEGEWLGLPPTGEPVEFTVSIFFPWDPEARKFKGERVHVVGFAG
jgi:predicted ester cyclase